MNLSGNKVVAASALFLAVNLANAAAPDLVEFTSGTAAKAAEVNSNFDDLKTYSAGLEDVIEAQAALIAALEAKATTADTERTALEDKISDLETESADLQSQVSAIGNFDEYTIDVYGDNGEEPIGQTNRIPNLNDGFILLKTDYGLAAIDADEGNYVLKGYNESKSEGAEHPVYFTDDQCSNAHVLTSGGEYGKSFAITKDGLPASGGLIITAANGNSTAYLLLESAQVDTLTTDFYSKNWEGDCEEYTTLGDTVSFPVELMTNDQHGLKGSYTSIKISDLDTH